MMTYGKYFKLKETFAISYMIIQLIVLPLLFWGDFINVEENHSKELLSQILNKMNNGAQGIINKLKLVEDSKNPISRNLYNKFNLFIDKLQSTEESF